MDAFRTPLVECFERGDVPRDVRLVAACGGLPLRVPEQLSLLMLLAADADAEVAAAAETTISRLPAGPLADYLASPEVPERVRQFFAAHPGRGSGELRLDGPAGDEGDAAAEAPPAPAADGAAPDQRGTVYRLSALTVAGRIKAAIQGSREERTILVRDPNRLVAAAVLSSPKLTESDVESFARMTSVSEDVLRAIGTHRAWTRNYTIVSSLTRNAKTPIPVSMALLTRLTERDVKLLSTDRNVPEPVRLTARKMYARNVSRRQ